MILSMGLLSLTVTGTTYLTVGLILLQTVLLDWVQLRSGAALNPVTGLIFEPMAALLIAYLPRWVLFVMGLGIIGS